MLLELLLWLIVVEVAAVAALPLAVRLFQALPDRGYAFSKPLGLLLVTYGIWLLSMLGYLEYRRATAVAVLVVVAAVNWWLWGAEAARWLRQQRRLVVWQEALFLLAGALGLLVRAYNSDIFGQEKFMDLAFFNGFLAAASLPAEDSWLAGYGMPYYPFGYLLLSVPARIAGLAGGFGYNLALVLVFALLVLLSTTLAANLSALLRGQAGGAGLTGRDWGSGLVSGLFVAVCGNLVGPLELLAARGAGSPGFWAWIGVKNLHAEANPRGWLPADGGWWWHASRVIPTIKPDGITEFPYFSFLLGDLHPHFTALPLLLLICALALAALLHRQPRRDPAFILVTGMALGVTIVANTWDLATFGLLYALVAVVVSRPAKWSVDALNRQALAWAIAPLPLGILLYSPYFVGYASQSLGLAPVPDPTPLVSVVVVFGGLLLLGLLLGLRLALPVEPALRAQLRFPAALGVLLMVGLIALNRVTAALALVVLLLFLLAAFGQLSVWLRDDHPAAAARLFLAGLVGLAFAVLLGAELIYIRDSFGTRMNTVFKFYYHVWLLLALAAGPTLALWWSEQGKQRSPAGVRLALGATAAGLLVLGLIYPVAATWSKSAGFRGEAALTGTTFLERAKPGDLAAIRWLASRPGRPRVLEAVGGDYEELGRVSAFSGLPTVIGWVGMKLQWRGQLAEFGRRQQDVETIYRRAERDEGLRILERYQVAYVFVGTLERQKYGPGIDERLGRWLTPVFRSGDTVVYAVDREEPLS